MSDIRFVTLDGKKEIVVGDTLIVKPLDMIVLEAKVPFMNSPVDESTITGELLPKDKYVGGPDICRDAQSHVPIC